MRRVLWFHRVNLGTSAMLGSEEEYKLLINLHNDLNAVITRHRYLYGDQYERSNLCTLHINILYGLLRLLNIESLQTMCKKGS